MFNIFNSNVFVEVGEAIGNVGRRLLHRHSQAEQMDESFHRHLQDPLHIAFPSSGEAPCKPEGIVIEGVFREITGEEGSDE